MVVKPETHITFCGFILTDLNFSLKSFLVIVLVILLDQWIIPQRNGRLLFKRFSKADYNGTATVRSQLQNVDLPVWSDYD